MKLYDLICCDCPFKFSDKLEMDNVKRGAETNYSILDHEALKLLSVGEIAAKDSVLAFWVPSSLLQEGLDIMKSWGFRQTQSAVWIKIQKEPFKKLKKEIIKTAKTKSLSESIDEAICNFDFNDMLGFYMGRLFRQTHEICLIGVKGKPYKNLKNKSQRSVHFDVNLKHSAKPEILQDRLDLMFPDANKLEIFARRPRAGWTTIGNQCEGDTMGQDIRDSLLDLKNK